MQGSLKLDPASLSFMKGSDGLLKTRDRLILLHQVPHITRRMLYRLKELDPTYQMIFTFTPSELANFFHISMKKSFIIYHIIHDSNFRNSMKKHHKHIHIITADDEAYPEALRMIPDAPLVLYLIGNVSLLKEQPMLSVVGTRKPSDEAYSKLTHIVQPLLEERWIIVSGLAYGIDSFAHRMTVDHGGRTIAVLGSGFHHIYPKKHTELCRSIVRDGLLVSEYAPEVKPRQYHFPERNRIISGLSEGTLVVEAAERSGTMITVDQALEQGKEVYAIPGSPLLDQTKGCNRLIQDGAKLVTNASDIMDEWPVYQP